MNEEEKNNQKQQEDAASKKVAGVAAKGAIDYFTAGQGGQVYDAAKKVPGVGKKIDKAEDKIGKAANKATGGKFGKAAKKADDAGALDMADKALSMGNGASNSGDLSKGSSAGSLNEDSVQASNPATLPKHNFAKEGFPGNDSGVDPGKSNGATARNFRDIQSRRTDTDDVGDTTTQDKKSVFDNFFKSKNQSNVFISVSIDKMVKKTLIPVAIFLVIVVLFVALGDTFNNDNDLAAVDEESLENNNLGGATNYYSNSDPKLKEFYDRVLEIKENYSKNGKSINAMYITATYHILQEYNAGVSAKDMDEDMINTLADGMLGNSTVYSEDTYRKFLTEEFLPNYISEKKVDKAVDRIFEYIEQYMEKHHPSSGCTTTTGSTCIYQIKGVHGSNHGPLDLSNLHVQFTNQSNAGLIPFENYVLGSAYNEFGGAKNADAFKVQLVASRSYAIARPILMNGANGLRYEKKDDKTILHISNSTNDQTYHDYNDVINNSPKLKKFWEETMGMIAVDENDKVVQLSYNSLSSNNTYTNQNKWDELAGKGNDYVEIILMAYPDVHNVKKMNCSETTEKSDSAFLQVAARIWKKMVDGNYSYRQGNSVPPSGNLIDCSTYVSWVLYEYGFKDEFGGPQHDTVSFVNTNWTSKMGWTEISVAAGEDVSHKLKAGDILVRDNGGGDYGHILIVSEVKSNGTIMGYEANGGESWKSAAAKGGKPVDVTYFAKNQWAGKIIRVSNVSGDSCQTAESGEALSWKQTDPKWASVPLGSSNVGMVGCLVTSIAIQIARSGIQTPIADFNPGTFAKELSKHGAFSSSGSLDNIAAIPQAVPGVVDKYHGVRLSGSKADKIKKIKEYLDQGLYIALNVKYGRHWVAVVGVTDNDIIMADPSLNSTSVFSTYGADGVNNMNVYQIG